MQAAPPLPKFLDAYLPSTAKVDLGDDELSNGWLRAAVTDASYVRGSTTEREAAVIVLEALGTVGSAVLKIGTCSSEP